MLVGLGIDFVELDRIRRSLERFGDLFLHRLLHPSERDGLERLLSCHRGTVEANPPYAGSARTRQDLADPEPGIRLRRMEDDTAPGGPAAPGSPETAGAPPPERLVAFTAARFAAKEAGAKALGTGFSGGIGLHDIRIRSLPTGRPVISFHGQALITAEALGVDAAHLSLTHARKTAGAVVVLETHRHSAVDHRLF